MPATNDASSAQAPRQHHYIPRFLLSRWTGQDGRLIRYEMPRPGKLVVSRRHPSEVGFVRDLYSYPGAIGADAQWLEHHVFQRIDDDAAKVLARLLEPRPSGLTPEQKSDWIRFVLSLMHRTPENLRASKAAVARIEDQLMNEIRARYEELRHPSDPSTFAEFAASERPHHKERRALEMLPGMMNHASVGQHMINMLWHVLDLDDSCPSLLLSDDPLARTNGMAIEGGHAAIPISPRRLLLMSTSAKTSDAMRRAGARSLARKMNEWTVESARRFVAAVDRSQERFVRNRFGRDPKPAWMSNLDKLDEMFAGGNVLRRNRRETRALRSALPERLRGDPA